MPTYDYTCDACGVRFERFQRMSEDRISTCPECASPQVRRLIGAGAGVIFRGSGFYETDYKRGGTGGDGGKAPGEGGKAAGEGGDAKAPAAAPKGEGDKQGKGDKAGGGGRSGPAAP